MLRRVFGRTQVRGVHTGVLQHLRNRGLIHDVTHPDTLAAQLAQRPLGIYAGVDPTAPALHIGHLLPLVCLLHFHLRGHSVFPLIGGATGRIGDPSGRLLERQPADQVQVQKNVDSLTNAIHTFFDTAIPYAHSRSPDFIVPTTVPPRVMNNLHWHAPISMLDFLQTVGVHARVNTMLNRESVSARLTAPHGLSFTEFTYQLLQAYDFYHLHRNHGCSIQLGGSDQWGNIVAGLDLIGRMNPPPQNPSPDHDSPPSAFGITTPLLTTPSGDKFGKSAGNAVWLDTRLTSVFDFYQYFIKVDDVNVEQYLKMFTFLHEDTITDIMHTHNLNPEKRTAQRRLAAELTELVHSPAARVRAEHMSAILFQQGTDNYASLSTATVLSAFAGDPRLVVRPAAELLDQPVFKLAARFGLVDSASAARALIKSRGLYVNNVPVPQGQHVLDRTRLVDGRVAVLRAGKDKIVVLVLEGEPCE